MDDVSRAKPRRPHHKSRTGCLQCKQRKVKCDETKPICTKCQGYKESCSFLQTHPLKAVQIAQSMPLPHCGPTIQSMLSPSPPREMYHPSNFSMLDMELLHFYTTTSAYGLLVSNNYVEIFRTAVVQVAFEYPFLMHEILSLAALHLAHIRPQKRTFYMHASDTHLATAISLFQPEITSLTNSNCHACFAFSTMIFIQTWAAQDVNKPSTLFFQPYIDDDETHIQSVKFHRGTNEILKTVYPILLNGPLGEVFSLWKDLDENRPDPLTPEEDEKLTSLTEAWQNSSMTEGDKTVLDQALSKLKRVFSMLSQYPALSRLAIVVAWFSWITDEYLKMLENKVPEAILIAVYYCVTLKSLENVWWMEGKPEHLFRTLISVLGDGWERWLSWPRRKLLEPLQVSWKT